MSEMKVCPYCGNEILAVAKKCKFCKQWLPEENVVSDNNSNDDAPTDINIQNVSTDTGNINEDPYNDLFVAMNKEIQNKKVKKGLMITLCVIALVVVVGLVTMLVTKNSEANNTIVPVQVGNQWGYIEKKTGAYVVKPQFDDAYSFANGLARVNQKGKWGYIDKTGQFVIKPQFDIAVDFTDDGLARVVINDKLGYIDQTGKYVINPQSALSFDFAKNGLANIKVNDKWGYIDKTGKTVITIQFDYAWNFAECGLACVKVNDKWGYIDKTGKFIIPPQFDDAFAFTDNGIAIVEQKEKWGYIDKTGKFVINPQFDEAGSFRENGLAVVKQKDKWGYIDKTGKFVINPQFDDAGIFRKNGLALVRQENKWGYIDKTGSFVIKPQFDDAAAFTDNGLARVEQKGKWGYIDKTGEYVINPQFDYAFGFNDDGLAIVKLDYKFGIIDKNGKYVVNPQFYDIDHLNVKSNTDDIAVDLVNKWDAYHNLKNTNSFAYIYAPQVKYYQQTYTPAQIIKSKQDLFSKTPGFQQSVSNFKVTNNTDGSVIVYFDKRVWSSAKKNPETYPSYLVVKKINGNWLIIEESDEITDENLAKKNANRQGKKPFITGLSQYKLYGATGGSYVYDGNGKKLNVTLSLNKYYMNCVISDGKGNNDNIPFKFDYKIDFSSRKNEYAIGRHDFDGDNIDEIVIGMFSPNDKDGDFAAVVVYRVLDRKKWDFHFAYRVNGVRIIVTNNEINVPWVPEYGMGFDMDCGYAFENGDFVNTELEEEYEEYEYE